MASGFISASSTLHALTSSQSWSSASIQNTATVGTPCSARTCSARRIVGERFQQREERSAEEPRLLTGDEGDGLRIPESCGCRGRGFRSPAAALLSLHEIGDRSMLTGVTLSSSDGVTPGRRIVGIAGKEVGDARMIEDVISGETPNPRKSADIDGKPGARGGVPGTCTRVGACLGRQT